MADFISINEDKRDFYQRVYDLARMIPKGRVTSYGCIAKALGATRSSRLVGWAMSNAEKQDGSPVPAHRVVNRNGLLTGKHHFNPPELMQQRLEAEGVMVKNDQIVNFEKVFWNPMKELDF